MQPTGRNRANPARARRSDAAIKGSKGRLTMAKTLTRIDPELIEAARAQARVLLGEVFAEARNRDTAPTAEALPPLFPNGVELIRLKFEIALSETAKLGIEIEVAGPKPASRDAESARLDHA